MRTREHEREEDKETDTQTETRGGREREEERRHRETDDSRQAVAKGITSGEIDAVGVVVAVSHIQFFRIVCMCRVGWIWISRPGK